MMYFDPKKISSVLMILFYFNFWEGGNEIIKGKGKKRQGGRRGERL